MGRLLPWALLFLLTQDSMTTIWNAMDIRYWKCVLKRATSCPDPDIKFFMYSSSDYPHRKMVDVRNPLSLHSGGWNPGRRSVIIIHGFNETESESPTTFITKAYADRGDYNVFTVDWESLTKFPCYLSALSNTRLVAQCAAMLYSYLTHHGARATKIQCVGHSLGANICGMMSRHLSAKMHKIIGLDPARPLVEQYTSQALRLTRDDAHIVQVIHTNAGFLGVEAPAGHVDFCVNNGQFQPGCTGHRLRQARCSHFQSACYFAATVSRQTTMGYPCTAVCPRRGRAVGLLPGIPVPMGEETPEGATGTYCVTLRHGRDCPFD
ncbi:phospholipase A1-like isoform X1 [Zootermopsis nevadensis]|uniref:Phospholipase A1 n=2 Tax=Zootermopsis nevadensis TaxID=136037 RepID=A0A067RD55_ZOONE|nr:phospholipase A1-like isoform X1 [Zootermopsis nevadensis]KDR21672.1 Phospholipase A1 [Zootermopsis nevadensis]